jgi:two-component system, NarL family, response regulator LiaR
VKQPVSVVLVDDHRVVTRGLRLFLESFSDIRVAGVARSGEELLARVAEWEPRVVVMDLLMPGGMDGVEATRRLCSLCPNVRVIALTASVDDARLVGVLRAGAVGYVRKDADPEMLLSGIRAVAQGNTFIDPSVSGPILAGKTPALSTLSIREEQVLRQITLGRTNREIAEHLSVGEETIKTHVARILDKVGLQHRAQLIAYALKCGLVKLDEL